ncbi:hypothetical protein BFR85_004240 [Acinetobacter pittii]|jgi:hypothetical protein|uniref:hypothetical protein n=1 Tax=Acinetobacter pittii TaxID=48296 RepID=UPI00083D1B6A|nr:hypothetical protein [Acinetobacter pittii]MCK0912249.1 hypothetical protein [Acinetobacter pittii]
MIKGLAITPPILGRISIGKVVEKNGKRIPEKDDQFTITNQIQSKDGWVKHPLDETSLKEAITTAKQIDEQSRQAGFYQEALDEVARLGYTNAKFEVESEEGVDVVEEFYHRDEQEQQSHTEVVHTDVRTLQKGLAQSVRAVN